MAVDKLVGGLFKLQFWVRESTTGYMIGNQTTLSAGATTNAVVINSVNATTAATRDLTILEFQGGDVIMGNMTYGDRSFAPFTVTFDSSDADDIALLHGTTVDSTHNTAFVFSSLFTDGSTVRNVGIMLSQKKINRDGSDGGTGFLHYVFPFCQVTAGLTIGGFQAKTQMTWNVSPQRATKTPSGTAFSAMAMATPNNEMDCYLVESTYPLAWAAFRSDGAATTFTPAYKPLSSVVTVSATENHFTINGTKTALTSFNTSTGLATMTAAGSSGDYNVLMYETNFVTTS